jgi:Raf kinase inhibitor-like YbhB/YbcL family protein
VLAAEAAGGARLTDRAALSIMASCPKPEDVMKLHSDSFEHDAIIPAEFAFGEPGEGGEPCVLAGNRNPHLRWDGAPAGTRSFAISCVDSDAPSRADDVNKADREVPSDLPRTDFAHWLMVDIPADCHEIAAGSCSHGVTAHGKQDPSGPAGSRQGINDYTGWFAGDADMAGDYHGYDGPCPPFNDSIVHRYRFRVYALDVEALALPGGFRLADFEAALDGHVLAQAERVGHYTLNRRLLG